jgi:hypothetical protein
VYKGRKVYSTGKGRKDAVLPELLNEEKAVCRWHYFQAKFDTEKGSFSVPRTVWRPVICRLEKKKPAAAAEPTTRNIGKIKTKAKPFLWLSMLSRYI